MSFPDGARNGVDHSDSAIIANGPGGNPPAFSMAVLRGEWRYRVDSQDALVWLKLPRELSGQSKALFVGLLFCFGLGFGIAGDVLPDWLAGQPEVVKALEMVVASYALWAVWRNWQTRRLAKRMIPSPVDCILTDWSDHLELRAGKDLRRVTAKGLRQVLTGPAHVFLEEAEAGVVIVPLAAFGGDAGAMAAFGADWDRRSTEAVP